MAENLSLPRSQKRDLGHPPIQRAERLTTLFGLPLVSRGLDLKPPPHPSPPMSLRVNERRKSIYSAPFSQKSAERKVDTGPNGAYD